MTRPWLTPGDPPTRARPGSLVSPVPLDSCRYSWQKLLASASFTHKEAEAGGLTAQVAGKGWDRQALNWHPTSSHFPGGASSTSCYTSRLPDSLVQSAGAGRWQQWGRGATGNLLGGFQRARAVRVAFEKYTAVHQGPTSGSLLCFNPQQVTSAPHMLTQTHVYPHKVIPLERTHVHRHTNA